MAIHADLTRYAEETFLPSLSEPHREAARLLHAQIRRLDELNRTAAHWFGPERAGERAECEKVLLDVAVEIREAYKVIVRLGQQTKDRQSQG